MRAQQKPTLAGTALVVALGLTLAGCAGPDPRAPNDEGTSAATEAQGSGGTPSAGDADHAATEKGADLATTNFAVSWREAVDAATLNFGGDLFEVELSWQNDSYAYTVELVSGSESYEVRIDADTGKQFDERVKQIDSDDLAVKTNHAVKPDAVVSWDDALATALDAQNGTVNEWKLEGTENGPQWQFDIDAASGEDYEVTVDAGSGDLITTDD